MLLKSGPFPSFSSCSPRSQATASPQTLQCPWIDSLSFSGEEGAGALLLPQSLTLHRLLLPSLWGMAWKSLLPQVPAPEVPSGQFLAHFPQLQPFSLALIPNSP